MSARTEAFPIRVPSPGICAATGELYDVAPEPVITGRVTRRGLLHWEWEVTVGPYGQVVAEGTALTKTGAKVEATVAGQRRRSR